MIDSALIHSIRDSAPDSKPGTAPEGEVARRRMAPAEEEAPSMWNLILRSGRCEGKDTAPASQAEATHPAGQS